MTSILQDTADKRRVVMINWAGKTIIGSGVCLYSQIKDKFLLVQRKHSSALLNILRNNFRSSELSFLIKNMTKDEIKDLSQAIKDKKLKELFIDILGLESAKYHLPSKDDVIFSSSFESLISEAHKSGQGIDENEWSFPKGRVEKGETNLQCALRELKEETLVSCSDIWLCVKNAKFISKHEVYTYEMFIFPAITFKDVETGCKGSNEVNKVDWFTKEEMIKKLNLESNGLLKMLDNFNLVKTDREEEKKKD